MDAREREALAARVADAEKHAHENGIAAGLAKLRSAAKQSKAMRARSIHQIYRLLDSDDELIGSFHDLIGAGLLRPKDSDIERARLLSESLIFPQYYDKIQFAALSLDDQGLFSYGSCCIVLRPMMIESRTTVFEENCVCFCRKLDLGSNNTEVPPGYRAHWANREDLVIAKLASRLRPETEEGDFARLLLAAGQTTANDDFIEVHIYNRLHRSAVDYVVVKKSAIGEGCEALLRAMKASLGDDRVKEV